MFSNPFFGLCFVFYLIPFWVPILGLISGADPLSMVLILILTVMSKAYIDSDITSVNPISMMFDYFFTKPILTSAKLLFTAFLLWVLTIYALSGAPLDKGIAAVTAIFVVQVMYFTPVRSGFWQIKGLRNYRIIAIGGAVLTAFLWLSFFGLSVHPAEKVIIGMTAMLVSALTFFKKNEGLI